jgi:hypothetical protein
MSEPDVVTSVTTLFAALAEAELRGGFGILMTEPFFPFWSIRETRLAITLLRLYAAITSSDQTDGTNCAASVTSNEFVKASDVAIV